MDRWKKFDGPRQKLMRETLETLSEGPELSRDVTEIINKALGQ